ncbi:site-specific integrase [Pontimicrobium sp. IMCC45349]|uniref:site-specific integrase n=1 Tax=Pontimicrobium sp. IMCC45349 TaxID=3391574 RepID=UPI0039A0B36F
MSNQKLYILFYPFKSRLNSKSLCPLKCRITIDKNRKEFSTGIFINPDEWDNENQEHLNNVSINNEIEILTSELKSKHLRLKISTECVSVFDLYNEYKGKAKKEEKGTSEFYQEYLKSYKKLVGKEIKQATWNKFYYVGNHLKKFIKWKYKVSDYPLNKLSLKFLDDFDFYLKTKEDHKQITINKILQRFRKVVKMAVAEKYIVSNPFILYKAKSVKHKVVYLTPEELKVFEERDFGNRTLDTIKDCFIFCCYTGLAYLEMKSLKYEHLRTGFDGQTWIFMDREKTSKPLSIPVLKQAQSIIDKYKTNDSDFVLPQMSNQKFNQYLKDIAGKLEINKRLTHHVARKTFATTVLLYNDVPMEIVSELLGHSSITITEAHYGKIVQKKVSDEMNRLRLDLD